MCRVLKSCKNYFMLLFKARKLSRIICCHQTKRKFPILVKQYNLCIHILYVKNKKISIIIVSTSTHGKVKPPDRGNRKKRT